MGPASVSLRINGVCRLGLLFYCLAFLLMLVSLQAPLVLGRATLGVVLPSRETGEATTHHHHRVMQEAPVGGDDRSDADRQLIGSSPPKCSSKCGRCTPCRPVHVPIQPGTLLPAEYYPEAWRCKCGNKLYMP